MEIEVEVGLYETLGGNTYTYLYYTSLLRHIKIPTVKLVPEKVFYDQTINRLKRS